MAADWQRVREVFERAVQLAPGERREWLARECTNQPEVLRGVQRLLAGDAASADVAIERELPGDLLDEVELPSVVGRRIGRYEILGVLGSGGMSTVFEATQEHPQRSVALKTMRFGFTSAAARRRFEYEVEVLGRLRHPTIAQVYEAGTWTEPVANQELPFFAMELVHGARPLDAYVRGEGLDLRAMLALFVRVCEGVHHGHQLGFVHRDLKPQNILVDSAGNPKIIDFGIARATDADAQARTVLTEAGQVLGTLRYMAPEQIAGDVEAIDSRVDVHALGIVLYELLTGTPPFGTGDTSLHALAERIQRDDPAPPSTLAGSVPRDLDWIVGKAIAKAPGDRYASVSELAADLRRFLAHEPVSAGPPSTAYRLRKFVRRNKVVVAALAGVFVALIAGVAATTWQLFETRAARDAAEHQASRVRGVNAFYNILLSFASPVERRVASSTPDVTMREALDGAAAKLDAGELSEIDDEPEIEADVRETIGLTYQSLDEFDKACRFLERALALRLNVHGERHADVAYTRNALGMVLSSLGRSDEAIEQYERAIAIYEALDPDCVEVTHVRTNLAMEHGSRGDNEKKRALLLENIAHLEAMGPSADRFRAVALTSLANTYRADGDVADAVARWRESIALYESSGKGWHPYSAIARQSLASALYDQEQFDEAERLIDAAIEIHESQGTTWWSDRARAHVLAFNLARRKQDHAAEESHASGAAAALRSAAGEETLDSLAWSRTAATCRIALERYDEAEPELLRILDELEREDLAPPTLGGVQDRQGQQREVLSVLVTLYERWGKLAEKAEFEARLAELR